MAEPPSSPSELDRRTLLKVTLGATTLAVVGTGLGGGITERGHVVKGAAGMAAELGHVHIPLRGLLEPDQPLPSCNCGFEGDAESIASLTAIERNLLPYWLGRYPGHELASVDPPGKAAKLLRGYGERDRGQHSENEAAHAQAPSPPREASTAS